jgi:hypothetical protein
MFIHHNHALHIYSLCDLPLKNWISWGIGQIRIDCLICFEINHDLT